MNQFSYKTIAFIVVMFIKLGAMAQMDTLLSLSFQNYIKLVTEHHPVAAQADLQSSYGDAAVLKAKGAFDPKLQTDVSQKYFNDKRYYSLIDGGLKVPTWFGVEFKAGYEVNDGEFLNEQNRTPNSGLLYAGISVPIGQGLIIDKRRAELKKAKWFQEGTELQRTLMLNDLLLEAGIVYWKWYQAHQELLIHKSAVQLATDRFNAVKQTALFGERPYIDTIEAGIQVQNRMFQLQQAQLFYSNATALLSIYLWSDGVVPMELNGAVRPQIEYDPKGLAVDSSYYMIMDTLITQHPELGLYGNKIDQLNVQRQWNREQLKPTLNLNYNPITEPIGGNPIGAYSVNNYTWGLTFEMPVLLRKERAELKMTNIQIMETQLDQTNKQAELLYKATAALNEWHTTYEQVLLYKQTVHDSNKLLEGERNLFNGGESSLFMINTRELSYIKTQLKLVELIVKNRMAEIITQYTFGLMPYGGGI